MKKSFDLRPYILDSTITAFLFSVLLIALFNPDSEQMLDLSMNASLFGMGIVLGIFLSHILNRMKIKTLGELLFEPDYKKAASEETPWYKTVWGWQLLISLLVTVIVGVNVTKFSLMDLLDEDGFDGAIRLFSGIFHPNFEVLPKAVINIIETIFMAFMAMALAVPVAFVVSFAAAKNIMKGRIGSLVYFVLRIMMNASRSVEALIWAIIFSVWVGIGPFAGMLALTIHSVASLVKQYSEMIETVNEGPIEGIESTGANKFQTIWYAIVPQVFLPFIAFTVYRWDINVRMATIIGLVGGGGIGTMLIQYQGQAMWPEVGCIILVIAVVVWAMDQASAYIREALK